MKKLVMVSAQGCDRVFEDCFDKVEFVSRDTTFDVNTTVMFEGGTDVNPALYGECHGMCTSQSDKRRDAFEGDVFRTANKAGASFIGICRGAQFLTVMAGGSLIQDVGNHNHNHEINTIGKIKVWVTSTHHQMCNPALNLKEGSEYVLIGWAAPSLSKYYTDGMNKRLPPPEFEPEVIWYPKTRSLAIQGHPEYLEKTSVFSTYSRNLVRELIFGEHNEKE
jgi:gamma-glutamyl-gamma-aminobutyrate hydrolase PuuD